MSTPELKAFDLTKLAENGLRRGRTTGTCAAAAAKAAVLMLVKDTAVHEVEVRLPGGTHVLTVPIVAVEKRDDASVIASVKKDGGDDPDATDGALISCVVSHNDLEEVRFLAGPGVGVVTEAGIRVAIGEPAINPVPRQMIVQAIADVVGMDQGFDVAVGCENGEIIAKKTFNPRLGIKGGISILGTTGIVEPLSLAAYMASIEVYIKVALAEKAPCVALLPGNIGLGFASKTLQLPKKRTVHISNYVGFALETVEQSLQSAGEELESLWILGHPGKLGKLLNGSWDTHSGASGMAMSAIGEFVQARGFDEPLVKAVAEANTVEESINVLRQRAGEEAASVWRALEFEIARICSPKVSSVKNVMVRLFDMSGRALVVGSQSQATS